MSVSQWIVGFTCNLDNRTRQLGRSEVALWFHSHFHHALYAVFPDHSFHRHLHLKINLQNKDLGLLDILSSKLSTLGGSFNLKTCWSTMYNCYKPSAILAGHEDFCWLFSNFGGQHGQEENHQYFEHWCMPFIWMDMVGNLAPTTKRSMWWSGVILCMYPAN